MTDKMREDFEAWYRLNGQKTEPFNYIYAQKVWQAATEQSTAKIAELQKQHEDDCELVRIAALECAQMQGRIDELVEVLNEIKEYVDRLPAKHNLNDCEAGSIWAMCINALPAIAKVKDVK